MAAEELSERLARIPRPLLLTMRDPGEGGAGPVLSGPRRRAWYEALLPRAACIDVELKALRAPGFRELAAGARARGVGVIGSVHDFRSTPGWAALRGYQRRAAACPLDALKVAATLGRPADLARLLDWLDDGGGGSGGGGAAPGGRLPRAVMGMGERWGAVSRLALAAAGSVLSYGYLGDEPAAPGQWPVARLAARLAELGLR